MARSLDFNSIKKKYLTVTLADKDKTVLRIGTPTKAVLDSLLNMKDSISDESLTDDAIDDLYEICAKIMSRNKDGKVITTEIVQELFDFEDIIFFIRAYTDFISEVSGAKN